MLGSASQRQAPGLPKPVAPDLTQASDRASVERVLDKRPRSRQAHQIHEAHLPARRELQVHR